MQKSVWSCCRSLSCCLKIRSRGLGYRSSTGFIANLQMVQYRQERVPVPLYMNIAYAWANTGVTQTIHTAIDLPPAKQHHNMHAQLGHLHSTLTATRLHSEKLET